MSISEKFIKRLQVECRLTFPANSKFKRTYAGRHQKAAGAFVWIIERPRLHLVAGYETVGKLIKRKRLTAEYYDYADAREVIEIDGED